MNQIRDDDLPTTGDICVSLICPLVCVKLTSDVRTMEVTLTRLDRSLMRG